MGGLNIFRQKYVVRRFKEQEISKGYFTAPYTDSIEELNVQPLSPDELQALPEGERQYKRLKAFGNFLFSASDQFSGTPGDWIFYLGRWYKCVSSVQWNHTMLAHCRSEFASVPETEPSVNLEPPTEVSE